MFQSFIFINKAKQASNWEVHCPYGMELGFMSDILPL